MAGDRCHPLIEDSHHAAIPAHPHLAAEVFQWDRIEGAVHLDMTVATDLALPLAEVLEAGRWKWQQRLSL